MKDKLKRVLPRAYAFLSALALSITIVSALPRTKQKRQRSFAQAITEGDFRRVRKLRRSGADINVRANGCMPLYRAAAAGRLDIVRYLLDEGADVNTREKLGSTALSEATFYEHEGVIRELLYRGADVNAIGDEGTALDIALKKGSLGIIYLLRHHGGKTTCELRDCG